MSDKKQSTFEREMQDEQFKKAFDEVYQDFVLSETLCELMKDGRQTVRKLANQVSVSPTVIQNIRSGSQEDIKLSNFINITHACGYTVVLEKGKKRIQL